MLVKPEHEYHWYEERAEDEERWNEIRVRRHEEHTSVSIEGGRYRGGARTMPAAPIAGSASSFPLPAEHCQIAPRSGLSFVRR
jgi:hypothetical protein